MMKVTGAKIGQNYVKKKKQRFPWLLPQLTIFNFYLPAMAQNEILLIPVFQILSQALEINFVYLIRLVKKSL